MTAISIRLPRAIHVSRVLAATVTMLIGLSLLGQYFKYGLGHPKVKGFVPMFYIDLEANVPTWYSSVALALAAISLFVVFTVKRRLEDQYRLHWGALGVIFLALSVDEISGFHELPIDPLRERFNAGGLLYYTWVVPGMLFIAAVGLAFSRFLLQLPARTRKQMLLAAFVFCGGAIGIEMLSGLQADRFGEDNLRYALIVTCEEACEMIGVVIFIHAILEYVERHLPQLRLEFLSTTKPNK